MKIHVLGCSMKLFDVETSSWNELEVKIRETLWHALGLENMDSVDLDFEWHMGLEEPSPDMPPMKGSVRVTRKEE